MLTRHLKLLIQTTKIYWQVHIQYRLGAIIWIINGMISPLIMMYIWLIVGRDRSLALDQHQIITYYLLSVLVIRLTQTWTAESLSNLIKNGRFSNYLVKPYSFMYERLASDFALRIVRLISLTPFIFIALLLFKQNITLSLNIYNVTLFITAVFIGYLLSLLIEVSVALLGFYLTDAYGTFLLLYLFKDLFSGTLIPAALMPPFLLTLSRVSPFYAQLGLPIDILMGSIPPDAAWFSFAASLGWIAFFLALSLLVFRQGIKKYTAVGL